MEQIHKPSLLKALGAMLDREVLDATFEAEPLHGGTLGDVRLLRGQAQAGEERLPFALVVKTQKQWTRPGDPNSWRREYDLYRASLFADMPQGLQVPPAYLLETEDGLMRIWMAYVDGRTGATQLNADELALAARRLGWWQAAYHLRGARDLPCLRDFPAVRSSLDFWHGRMAPFLADGDKMPGFPDDVRLALLEEADRSAALLERVYSLPLTLCHGDVHHDNLFLTEADGETVVMLIDWDTAGYGRMGEDAVDMLMEAFVYSDRAVTEMPVYRARILQAYREGAAESGVMPTLDDDMVRAIFLLAWAYRVADLYLYYEKPEEKQRCVDILRVMLRA